MKKTMYVLFALIIAVSCNNAGKKQPKPAEQEDKKTETATQPVIRDTIATITFEGKTYTYHIGEIGTDKDGHVSVEIKGKFDFASKSAFDGAYPMMLKALDVKIMTGESSPELSGIIPHGGRLNFSSSWKTGSTLEALNPKYIFKTTQMPDKIIVSNDESSTTFDGKTKEVIK